MDIILLLLLLLLLLLQIAFIRPTLARDSLGREVVVVQGGGVAQTVSVDSCRGAGQPCPGHCGTSQSICVQRFTHHHLLALPRYTWIYLLISIIIST